MEPTQIKAKPATSVVARVLAPLALIAAAIAVALVISGSLDDSGGSGRRGNADNRPNQERQAQQQEETYVVQPGDTLETIAQKTGVSVEELQRRNPGVDPQALQSGTELELR
jgi:LysM repeat protein